MIDAFERLGYRYDWPASQRMRMQELRARLSTNVQIVYMVGLTICMVFGGGQHARLWLDCATPWWLDEKRNM